MHEMSIASALLEQVELSLPGEGRLVEVRIAVGALEHLDSEVMRLAWESLVFERPRVSSSVLRVNHVSLRIRCRKCGHVYEPEDIYGTLCPQCASAQPEILQGSGIVLTGLSVDQELPVGKE